MVMKISVSILSYNRRDELRYTLTELAKTSDYWHEIIVADNASFDGTPEMVRAEFPNTHLIEMGENLGIVGSNQAYEAATGDWVLSLDDDSTPDAKSFDRLKELLLDKKNIAAISLSVRRKKTLLKPLNQFEPIEKSYGFSSSGVLFNRRAVTKIGVYDPELFLFTNELHWTARAITLGWDIAKANNVTVYHRSVAKNRSSAIHAYLYTRNTLLFLLRYAPLSLIQSLITRYFQWTFAYTLLHQTTVYLKAVRSALKLNHKFPEKRHSLDEVSLLNINPDLRAGFSHLG
jgi:GT2 family glycosyltransferase